MYVQRILTREREWEIKGDAMWSPGAGRKESAKGRQGTDSVLEPPEGTTAANTLVSILLRRISDV